MKVMSCSREFRLQYLQYMDPPWAPAAQILHQESESIQSHEQETASNYSSANGHIL